uniref:NXPE C-terminal domain-containing protein n=1 Tax=Denticeps clupeoides TaxID=299321 RepID=A0AAY4C7R0_9TELE
MRTTHQIIFIILIILCITLIMKYTSFQLLSGLGATQNTTFRPTDESSTSFTLADFISLEEWTSLLALVEWPSPTHKLSSPVEATDPTKCLFTLVSPDVNYTVGNVLTVQVVARDATGKPKTHGGDFFQAKIYSTEQRASTYGEVIDNYNGTYTVQLALLWPGPAKVLVRLIHSSEAVQVLRRQREQYPDKVFFTGYFKVGNVEETVVCNADRSAWLAGSSKSVCKFTDLGTGELWFCQKPPSLPCDSWVHHSFGGYRANVSTTENSLLSKSSTDVKIPGSDVTVNVLQNISKTSKTNKCLPGLETPVPAGFYFQDKWTSLLCKTQSFTSADQVSACIKDKQILMMGDSTLRQWFEYLLTKVPSLKKLNLHTSEQSGPFEAVDTTANVRLEWRAHGLPLRTSKTPWADLHYIANEMKDLAGGEHTVVVFTIWAHFTTYPLTVYVRRLSIIRKAVIALLQRSSNQTLVVIKSANTGYKDVYGSDWLSWQLDRVLRAMFKDLHVVIIDVWQMTSCHSSPDNIHPPAVVIENEVELFLSFVCPK